MMAKKKMIAKSRSLHLFDAQRTPERWEKTETELKEAF
jgi:hypothetical protein